MSVCKWFTWFCEKLFDEFEARDFIAILIVLGAFILIWRGAIPDEQIVTVIGAITGYIFGRPNSRDGGDEK